MAVKLGGLFAASAPPASPEDDDAFDTSEDSKPADDESAEGEEPVAGPFDAYAETVLDAKAPLEERKSALREAIMTLLEENGHGGMPPMGGLGGR